MDKTKKQKRYKINGKIIKFSLFKGQFVLF